jgi:hypothetical protein
MRVQVIVSIDSTKETALVGEATVFGSVDYTRGEDRRLRDIGFYLNDWNFAGHGGAHHKGWCFIPWGSALYVVELK